MIASPPIETAVDWPRPAAGRVEDRYAVDVATPAAGRDAADDAGALAVVQALARQVHRLAPGDPLDDEGRGLVDEDAHAFSTARRAASLRDTDRSAYSTP